MKSYCSPWIQFGLWFFFHVYIFSVFTCSQHLSVVSRKVPQSIQIQCVYCELSKIHRSLQKLSIFIVIFMWKQKHLIWVWSIRLRTSFIHPPQWIQWQLNGRNERKSPKTLRNTIQIANDAMSTQIRSDRRFTLIETVVSFSPRAFCVWQIFCAAKRAGIH